MKKIVVAWWSAGITSAVAVKMALELYDNVVIYYIHIDSANPDNERFRLDCEKWYGQNMIAIKSSEYRDQFDVIEKTGMVNGPTGARCTLELKKQVRFQLEQEYALSLFNNTVIGNQVWGFEYDIKQINRAIRFGQQYPYTNPLFPLIEKGINKDMCAGMLMKSGILLPIMYVLGYNNNNCIGCVKGGKGYWNKIRVDFPEYFCRMAKLERKVGYSCINGVFLDELDPKAGRMSKEVMPSCGIICEVEFADLPDVNLSNVLNGSMSIYDAIKNQPKITKVK